MVLLGVIALLGAIFIYLNYIGFEIPLRNRRAAYMQKNAMPVSPTKKKVAVTGDKLDEGLGIGLSVYQDYHTLLEKTKDHGIEWSFTGEGNSLRLSAPGVKVYVSGNDITAYTVKFDEVFAEEHWGWWVDELAKAGLSEKTTSLEATGQSTPQMRVSLYGTRSIHQNQGWATPAFELSFFQDRLDELHAGIKPGPGPDQPSTR